MKSVRRMRSMEIEPEARTFGASSHAPGAPMPAQSHVPTGAFVREDGDEFYRIESFDRLPPFLVNLPTDTDLWMFISSAGGLTAGRRAPEGAIFPYETVDRLHDGHHHTGPLTLLSIERDGRRTELWEPFVSHAPADGAVRRTLAKNTTGNTLVFEELHAEARLSFRYTWSGSDETGWVRTASLTNLGSARVTLTVFDGVRNLLPSGIPLLMQQQSSCLVDAYKRVDVDAATGLGIVSLTSRISDRPEPAEELRATTAWCHGLPKFRVSVSSEAAEAFRAGRTPQGETVLTGRRGNYFVSAPLALEPGERSRWCIALDTGRSHADIAKLRARLLERETLAEWIDASLRRSTANLRRIVGSSDGLQLTGDAMVSAHHFANVLFNDLRGGVFVDNHRIPVADFVAFVAAHDRQAAQRHADAFAQWPNHVEVSELHAATARTGDADLRRLGYEYLSLYFGRRHGDPSRPWNRFSIAVRQSDGSQALRYEGNWRDIFQNWEALTLSFPDFLPGVIAKFVNASTVDGFNPYRVSRDGVDWEVLDPGHPWSGIGYWGDHQVIYLLRLLESMQRHFPGALQTLLPLEIFSYADVPYRLKPYADMLANPKSTIVFDHEREAEVARRVAEMGQDGKLVHRANGHIQHASLLEKLIVPALSKLSSYIPGGGIWMNTERPEWNDANNALVGHGLSVVTLCHLRRYLEFVDRLLAATPDTISPVAFEVAEWLRGVAGSLERHRGILATGGISNTARRQLMDELGAAFTSYRERVYAHGFSGSTFLAASEVRAWCRSALDHVDHSIRANRREDGLYHSYNLLESNGEGAAVRHLDVMLEGQVAALSSGLVEADEAVRMIDALYASPLYRADQDSFLLYPNRRLPSFLERNAVPGESAAGIALLEALLAANEGTILERDAFGVLRFCADFSNARDVNEALDRLATRATWRESVVRDRAAVVALFEQVFGHRTYTGRSGTMYAYEGLGSTYWHMVAKLLLAVQEIFARATDEGASRESLEALARMYYRIRGGLGFEKTAERYGAFPADPYSHTPAHAGAQQPGMTGQVKEEILTRFGELGVRVEAGVVRFAPRLLRRGEFLSQPGTLHSRGLAGEARDVDVAAGSLAFTYCQVPIVYTLVRGEGWIRVVDTDGVAVERSGDGLGESASQLLLSRIDGLRRIEVGVPENVLFAG